MPDFELGGLDINVKADAKGIEEAYSQGGKAAVQSMKQAAGQAAGLSGQGAAQGGGLAAVGAGAAGGRAAAASAGRGGLLAIAKHPVVLGAIAVLGGLAIAGKKLKDGFRHLLRESERLARLNASLATAAAISRLGGFRRDVTRANVIGPTMLKVTQLIERLKNLLAPIVNYLLKALARALEAVLRGLVIVIEAVYTSAINFVQSVSFMAKAAVSFADTIVGIIKGLSILGGITGIFLASRLTTEGLAEFLKKISEDMDELRKSMERARDDQNRNANRNSDFMNTLAHLAGRQNFGQLIPAYQAAP